MAMTQTEVLGFNTKVIAAINENGAACQAGSLDVSSWAAEQAALAKSAGDEDALQEKMKLALRAQTTKTENAFKAVYDKGSTRLDAMAGAVGKTTPLGKSLLALRSDVRRGPEGEKPSPPTTP